MYSKSYFYFFDVDFVGILIVVPKSLEVIILFLKAHTVAFEFELVCNGASPVISSNILT